MVNICTVCHKSFTRLDSLKRHMKTLHKAGYGGGGGGGGCGGGGGRCGGGGGGCGGGGGGCGGGGGGCGGGESSSGGGGGGGTAEEARGNEFTFHHPFTMLCVAPTGFGKTYYIKQLLENQKTMITPPPERIIWCYGQWQELYEEMKESIPNIEFYKGLPPNLSENSFLDINTRNILVIDDLMAEASKDSRVQELFTKGSHHRNFSVICLLENFYFPGTQTLRRNTHYMILFNMPVDKTQVRTISRQMFPEKPTHMLQMYENAISKPYGCIVIDLKPNTNPNNRLKTDILPHEQAGKGYEIPKIIPKRSYGPPPPGIPANQSGEGTDSSDDEDRILQDHRRGYLVWQWLQDSSPNAIPPDRWRSYLSAVEGESKKGVNNPLALVHLAAIEAKNQGNAHLFLCPECNTNSLKAYYLSTCPMCSHTGLYPKLPGETQMISCSEDGIIFETNYKTCQKRIGICMKCKEGFVVDHQQPKSGGMYPEVTVPLRL